MTTDNTSARTAQSILERAGFEIRGRRASCAYCPGHRKLTVSIRGELWFCHRCHKGGNVRSLAHEHGISLPARRIRKADFNKSQFRAWLSQKMTALGNEERRAYKMKDWACAALYFDSAFAPAWSFLAWFYTRRYVWERFWESASDRVGRLDLYKAWRRHGFN